MDIMSELFEYTKQSFSKFLDLFLEDIGIVGTFFDTVFIRPLKMDEAQQLFFLNSVRPRSFKINFLMFNGYVEMKRFGSRERLILNGICRFREKVSGSVGVSSIDGKAISKRLIGEIFHIFHIRFDLYHLLYVFGYGMNNRLLSSIDPYRPIKGIDHLLTIQGIIQHERSSSGFLTIVKNNLGNFIDMLMKIFTM